MDPSKSHFDLFGLPVSFAIADEALERAYREIQSRVHPDRFARATEAERRVAMQRATQANEAFQTLKHPLRRAVYLLSLRGVEVNQEGGTAMDPVFLHRQLEWREAIEEARAARKLSALQALLGELRSEKASRYARLADLLGSRDDRTAAESARQLMFIEKVEREIGDSIESLEEARQ